jgi:hypothetical protein
VTMNVDRAQFNYPRANNRDGAIAWEIPFKALPGSGNDEYSIVFE